MTSKKTSLYVLPDALLSLLIEHGDISGETCAEILNISRSAVQKHCEKLRSQGWLISAIPKKGLSLQKPYPFALIPEIIKQHISSPLLFIQECSSTNTLAKTIKYPMPFTFITRSQNQGSGRAGRSWQMQADKDIALTHVCHSILPLNKMFSFIRLASLSVLKTLTEIGVKDCLIKWPNDIITQDNKKICGILTQSLAEENSINTLYIGIGINVNSDDLPAYAQSIKNLLGHTVDINMLAASLISKLERGVEYFSEKEEEYSREWGKNLAWLNQTVTFQTGNNILEGVFLGCEDNGAIILEIEKEKKCFTQEIYPMSA